MRPPKANREWITRLLDAGVWNLHCPQVESAAHAREIVAASRYAPRGLRGNGGLGPSTDFETNGSVAERRAFANDEVFVTVMFETQAAFADLDEIAAMDGIDALTLGPADLAQDMGVFGTPDQARALDEKRDLILAAARKHGKTCSMLVSSAAHRPSSGRTRARCCSCTQAMSRLCTPASARRWRKSAAADFRGIITASRRDVAAGTSPHTRSPAGASETRGTRVGRRGASFLDYRRRDFGRWRWSRGLRHCGTGQREK